MNAMAPPLQAQLAQGGIALTVDQNPHRQHAGLAVGWPAPLETGYRPISFVVEFILYSARKRRERPQPTGRHPLFTPYLLSRFKTAATIAAFRACKPSPASHFAVYASMLDIINQFC